MLLLLIVLIILFGGGGVYMGEGPYFHGGLGLGGVLLIILVFMLLTGRL